MIEHKPLLDILIPTFNNWQQLNQCVNSLGQTAKIETKGWIRINVINNGHPEIKNYFRETDSFKCFNMDRNLGWEGGIKKGLELTDAPFVMFLNDDTYFPQSSCFWANEMLSLFSDKTIGAVGPTSNVVMGLQNIWFPGKSIYHELAYWIGFCIIVRREAFEKAGGVDMSLPGGDDLDQSVRMKDVGYKIICDRKVFVYHHGFQTGKRVHGDYWNSLEMSDKTTMALIKKHGVRKWFNTITGEFHNPTAYRPFDFPTEDMEAKVIISHINGDKNILELGCGGKKIVPYAIGMDMVSRNELIPDLDGKQKSVADIVGDAEKPLILDKKMDVIVARHILEHCVDTVGCLQNWKDALVDGGRMIIAVPWEGLVKAIPLHPEHFHAFTPQSLSKTMELIGMKTVVTQSGENGISFVGVYQKGDKRVAVLEKPVEKPMGIKGLPVYVDGCIEMADRELTKLTQEVFDIPGMSSRKNRILLNHLGGYPGTKYLEIGSWRGSTLISALYGNSVKKSVAIENFSGIERFIGDGQSDKDVLLKNIKTFGIDVELIEGDCFSMALNQCKDKFNLYFYDGAHDARSQKRAFEYFDFIMENEFVAVVDDWNLPEVQEGTRTAFQRLEYNILYEKILLSDGNQDKDGWWNGLGVFVIRKRA